MHKLLNRATPLTAATVTVPDSLPGMSNPAWRPMDIVTWPLNAVTVLPLSSFAVTSTGGWMVAGHIGDVPGCTVTTSFVGASLSANTVASHVRGESNTQVHWGSTEPALAGSAYPASTTIWASEPVPMLVKPAGLSIPSAPFVIDTPYASAPAATGIDPGSATVGVEPEPDADLCAPNAVPNVVGRAPDGIGLRLDAHGRGSRIDSGGGGRSEEHTSELQSLRHLVCR